MPSPKSPLPPPETPEFNHVKKDTLNALSIWAAIEFFSFVLLPTFRLVEGNKYLTWLLTSVPLGLVGALLVGISSEFIYQCQQNERIPSERRSLLIWLGQLGGWLGLAGIGFPLSIVGLELWLQFQSKGLE